MANINEFKAVLKGGGARANQFQVTMPFPGFAAEGGETRQMSFLCKATHLPGQTIAEVPVPFAKPLEPLPANVVTTPADVIFLIR